MKKNYYKRKIIKNLTNYEIIKYLGYFWNTLHLKFEWSAMKQIKKTLDLS